MKSDDDRLFLAPTVVPPVNRTTPGLKGGGFIGGLEYNLSAWEREDGHGCAYLSIAARPAKQSSGNSFYLDIPGGGLSEKEPLRKEINQQVYLITTRQGSGLFVINCARVLEA